MLMVTDCFLGVERATRKQNTDTDGPTDVLKRVPLGVQRLTLLAPLGCFWAYEVTG